MGERDFQSLDGSVLSRIFVFVFENPSFNVSIMKSYRELISINPNIRFGKPCVKNTRISVGDILGWLAAGMTNEEIMEDFPELSIEAIRAALAFAADREESIKILAAA